MKKKVSKAKAPALLKLDLGAGQNPREGFAGVDIVKTARGTYVADLTKKWPWKNESVEEVYSNQFLEHLTGMERIHFMEELWRVLIPGGKALIVVPYFSSMRAIQDPTHQWPPLAETSFLYYNRDWRQLNALTHYPITCDFDFVYGYGVSPKFQQKNEETRTFASAHYVNAIEDLYVTLTKKERPE
jgi:hypothetical protein